MQSTDIGGSFKVEGFEFFSNSTSGGASLLLKIFFLLSLISNFSFNTRFPTISFSFFRVYCSIKSRFLEMV